MIRFLVISILLHLLVLGLMFYRSEVSEFHHIVSLELSQTSVVKPVGPPSLPPSRPSQQKSSESSRPVNTDTQATQEESHSSEELGNFTVAPRVIKQFKAPYPQTAKDAGVQGAVKLLVTLDAKGEVQEVLVLEGPGFGLNETAQAALKNFLFSPAERDGEKVPVKIEYLYRFRLDSR